MGADPVKPALTDTGSGGFWTRPPVAAEFITSPGSANYTTSPFTDENGRKYKFARGLDAAAGDATVVVKPLYSNANVTLLIKDGQQKGFFFRELISTTADIIVLF